MGAFVLVRPETPLVLLAMLALSTSASFVVARATRSSADESRFRRGLALVALGGGCFVLLLALRRFVFGAYFPNSALAKTAAFALVEGASYVAKGASMSGLGFVLAAAAGAALVARELWFRRLASGATLVLGLALANLSFALASG